MQWQLVGFATISAVLVAVSWRSLRRPRSHGFPRLFAWECIAALFLLVVPDWWREPLAWHQLVSWVLMTLSIIPAVWGFVLLARSGRQVPGRRAADPALLPFEATSRLVTTGIYRYIRHPLYSSLLLLTWGIFFKRPTWAGALLALAATGFLIWTARTDEAECRVVFGEEYDRYLRTTRRFIPFIL